jgi:pyruvate/2-oxoglutarate dehydrogenase complex dihydrolipoamide acyltransferase (E2) component
MNSTAHRVAFHWAAVGGLVLTLGLAGCGSAPPAAAPAPAPARAAEPAAAAPAPAATSSSRLPAPAVSKNWNEFKLQAAKRMVAANPNGTYTGKPQQMLLAIPVLEMELNSDGSIKNIDIMRRPSQAPETTQMAIDAVKRAAPFGDVSKLPKPWKFAEAFLFNDDKRFKPRTLDAN